MPTEAQTEANRLNAQKSTGPTSEEGKANSKFNAFKHGAYAQAPELTGHDRDKIEQRKLEYVQEYQPVGAEEIYHAQVMFDAHNEQDLCRHLSNAALQSMLDKVPEDCDNPIGEATCLDYAGPNCLDKLARRYSTANRRWLRSNKLLREHQSRRFHLEAMTAERLAHEAREAQMASRGRSSRNGGPCGQPGARNRGRETRSPARSRSRDSEEAEKKWTDRQRTARMAALTGPKALRKS